jgi:hypothetical protein
VDLCPLSAGMCHRIRCLRRQPADPGAAGARARRTHLPCTRRRDHPETVGAHGSTDDPVARAPPDDPRDGWSCRSLVFQRDVVPGEPSQLSTQAHAMRAQGRVVVTLVDPTPTGARARTPEQRGEGGRRAKPVGAYHLAWATDGLRVSAGPFRTLLTNDTENRRDHAAARKRREG